MEFPKPFKLYRQKINEGPFRSFDELHRDVHALKEQGKAIRQQGDNIGNVEAIIGTSVATVGAIGIAYGIKWCARHAAEKRAQAAGNKLGFEK